MGISHWNCSLSPYLSMKTKQWNSLYSNHWNIYASCHLFYYCEFFLHWFWLWLSLSDSKSHQFSRTLINILSNLVISSVTEWVVLCGMGAYVFNCTIIVCECELHLQYSIHFWSYALGKKYEPLYFFQLWVKLYHFSSFIRMDLVLSNPSRLICY